MKKIGFFILLFNFLSLTSFSIATEGSTTEDFLEQAFDPAIQRDTIVGGDSIGRTKKSVGNYILKDGIEIDIKETLKNGKDGIKKRPSLIVSVTKFILRMTIVLAVTMVIYNGILYIIKASEGENPKKILKNLIYIGVGILLGLFSIIIIRLVSSIGTSSLNNISYKFSSFIS